MRVAVLGAGAIGAYVGAALARGGTDVHLIARGANLEAIRRDGVKVLSERGDFEARPPAIGCVVYAGTELEAPGVVRHLEGTRFTIGEPNRTVSERCREFSEAMIAGGLKCPVEQDVRDEIWVKLMGNVAFNPLSALTRSTMAQICRHPDARQLVANMMAETLEIAEAVGAHPQISIEKRLAGAERVGEHKTSTLQDLEAGKPLELAAIIGAVVELADLTGIDAPALRAVDAASSLLAQTLGLADGEAPRRTASAAV